MAKCHELKVWPSYFKAIMDGRKRFEVRLNDRDFAVGDTLVLLEYQPDNSFGGGSYTKRSITAHITYIVQGIFGLPPLLCVMGIEVAAQAQVSCVR